MLGQQVTPLDRVGLYVPGGKAAYPSSVLMNAVAAKVAGVPELVMVVPTPDGAAQRLRAGGGEHRGRGPRLPRRRRAGRRGARLRHAHRARRRQDRRPRQRLRRGGQAPRVRPGRHRHGRRALRDPRDGGRHGESRLGRDGPLLAGRARRDRAGDPAHAGRRASPTASSRPCAGGLEAMPRRAIIEASLAQPRRAHRRARPRGGLRDRQPDRARSTWSLPWRTRTRCCRRSATPAPSSWVTTPRSRSATTAPGRTTCCRPRGRRASPRRSASTTSRSARASSAWRAPRRPARGHGHHARARRGAGGPRAQRRAARRGGWTVKQAADWVRDEIRALTAYHVAPSAGLVKLDAMENPYRLPPDLAEELGRHLARGRDQPLPGPAAPAAQGARCASRWAIPGGPRPCSSATAPTRSCR